jgi:hypothetical protein
MFTHDKETYERLYYRIERFKNFVAEEEATPREVGGWARNIDHATQTDKLVIKTYTDMIAEYEKEGSPLLYPCLVSAASAFADIKEEWHTRRIKADPCIYQYYHLLENDTDGEFVRVESPVFTSPYQPVSYPPTESDKEDMEVSGSNLYYKIRHLKPAQRKELTSCVLAYERGMRLIKRIADKRVSILKKTGLYSPFAKYPVFKSVNHITLAEYITSKMSEKGEAIKYCEVNGWSIEVQGHGECVTTYVSEADIRHKMQEFTSPLMYVFSVRSRVVTSYRMTTKMETHIIEDLKHKTGYFKTSVK